MSVKINYEHVIKPIEELTPYARNSRAHSDAQIEELRKSLNEFGFTNPVLIDENGQIIAGHGRVMAAKLEELEQVPCIVLKGLSDAQKRAYVIADNKIPEHASWNEKLLTAELLKLQDDGFDLGLTGFDKAELDKLLGFEDEEKKEVIGEVVFSEELGEMNNYVVLIFDNEIDWLSAQTHFGLTSKYSTRSNGKPWNKGVGRVVNGGEYLERINNGE